MSVHDYNVERARIDNAVRSSHGRLMISNDRLIIPAMPGSNFPLSADGLNQANTFIELAQLRTSTVLRKGFPVLSKDQTQTFDSATMRDMSKKWSQERGADAEIAINTFNRDEYGAKAAKTIYDRGALPLIRQDKITTFEMRHKRDGEWVNSTIDEIDAFFKRNGLDFGVGSETVADMGKLAKRASTLMSTRPMMTADSSELGRAFKAGVFDPKKPFSLTSLFGEGKLTGPVPEKAADASFLVSKGFLEEFVTSQRLQVEELFSEGRAREAYKLIKDVNQMATGIASGTWRGQLNVAGIRYLAMNEMDPEIAAMMKKIEGGIIKGMGVMSTRLDKLGLDFLLGEPNISTEIRARGDELVNLPGVTGYHRSVAVTPLESKVNETYMDIQSLTSNPELFGDARGIIQYNKQEIERMVADLQRDVIHRRLTTHLEDEYGRMSEDELRWMEKRNAYRQQISELIDAGVKPSESRPLMSMLLRETEAHLERGKLLIPDSISAYLLSDMQHEGKFPGAGLYNAVPRGSLMYSPHTHSWVYSRHDAEFLPEILGGGDDDDRLVAMLRWDTHNQQLILPGYRNPNSKGEWFNFTIDPHDEGVIAILKNRDPHVLNQYLDMTEEQRMKYLAKRFPNVDSRKLGAQYIWDSERGITLRNKKGLVIDSQLTRIKGEPLAIRDAEKVAQALKGSGAYGVFANAQMLRFSILDTLSRKEMKYLNSLPGFDRRVLPSETFVDVQSQGGRAARVRLYKKGENKGKQFEYKTRGQLKPYEVFDPRAGEKVTITPKIGDKHIEEFVEIENQTAKEMEELFYGLAMLRQKQGEKFKGKVSKYLFDERARPSTIQEAMKAGAARAGYHGNLDVFLTPNTVYDLFPQEANSLLAEFSEDAQRVIRESKLPDFVAGFKPVKEYEIASRNILHEWAINREPAETDLSNAERWALTDEHIDKLIGEFGRGDPERINKLVLTMLQQSQASETYTAFFTHGSIPEKYTRAIHYARVTNNAIKEGTIEHVRSTILKDLLFENEQYIPPSVEAEAGKAAAEEIIVPGVKATQRLIDRSSLRELFESPLAKGVGLGVAALAGLGLVRGFLHREPPPEHGAEQGPQAMPGGNPYDSMAPTTTYGGSASGSQNQGGVRYTVNVRGNHDQSALQNDLMGIDSSLQFRGGTTYYASRNSLNNNANDITSSY